jgi:heme/copper-type cytochrome/quinol oxidase subunit 2
MGTFGLTELILILIVMGCGILLPVIALIDILKSKFEGNDNIMLVLIVILVPVIGPILYFILGPSRKIKKE